jgi:signal recognition particle receptor subunit beta
VSTVNVMAREIGAKIVFYGPGLSGKTTSLKRVYDSVKPAHRGELMSLPTEADRTLFFDFLPVRVERVGDYAVRLALYTVPGQVFYNATRKLVLQGADGVVFVADSQPGMRDANIESMANLEENLAEQGIRVDKFPLVIQYNKRDLTEVLPVSDLRPMLNARGVPDFETCATSGEGVLNALKAAMRLVIKDLREKRVVPSSKSPAPSPPAGNAGLEDQLQALAGRPQLSRRPPLATPAAGLNAVPPSLELPPKPHPPELGPCAALAPSALLDYARAADAAWNSGDHLACVRACRDAVRRALSFAGEGPAGAQAHLLGVEGRDLVALEKLESKQPIRIDDAAFALMVLMQSLARLVSAGLPATPE